MFYCPAIRRGEPARRSITKVFLFFSFFFFLFGFRSVTRALDIVWIYCGLAGQPDGLHRRPLCCPRTVQCLAIPDRGEFIDRAYLDLKGGVCMRQRVISTAASR